LAAADPSGPDPSDFVEKWDPAMMRRMVAVGRPLCKVWFRTEVRGLEELPAGGALIVSNHSGGPMTMDVPLLWIAFYEKFGYDRPMYNLAHDVMFKGPFGDALMRMGVIPASRDNAAKALGSGALVIVFPGGDIEVMRPTLKQNTIDFSGRTGYVATAIKAGVPIVPAVSIGGQETQFFLPPLMLPKWLGLKRLLRSDQVPFAMGFPLVLSVGAYNLPLPAKIVTQILPPIDIVAQFGKTPDVAEVDEHVRTLMQSALDRLAAQRRFPFIG
jgi:1-acyl-sn-glycerol-3-phosphate acyltransferase